MVTVYRDQVDRLLRRVQDARAGAITPFELQHWVWQTALQVVLLEEAPLRDYLEHIDGELERLRFG